MKFLLIFVFVVTLVVCLTVAIGSYLSMLDEDEHANMRKQ